MAKSIVFDIGGVVVNFDPKGWLAEHFPNGDAAEKLLAAVFKSPEWDAFDRGNMAFTGAAEVFLRRGEEMGLADEMRAVVDAAFDLLSTREGMAAMMDALAAKGVDMYYLSNVSPEVKEMLQQRPFWQLFTGGIASSDVDMMKPEPEFFSLLLERYGLAAADCLFFDDTLENVRAACALGLDGHHFTGDEGFRAVLAQNGIVLDA